MHKTLAQVLAVIALFAVLVGIAWWAARPRKSAEQVLDEARARYHEENGYGEGCFTSSEPERGTSEFTSLTDD